MYVSGIDFYNMEAMKYYAPPANWDVEKKKNLVKERIFSGEWAGARKRDGSWWMFIKDDEGRMALRGRSTGVDGEYPNKLEWVPHLHDYFKKLPNGTVLIGELYLPDKEQSRYVTTILGCLKDKAILRQTNEKLHYYIFDILAIDGQILLNESLDFRLEFLHSLEVMDDSPYIEIATYEMGEELWDSLQSILASGGEGVVITRLEAPYQPGKRPSKDTLKVKKEVRETIDAFFTGRYTIPTKNYTGKFLETWKYWINDKTGEKLEGEYYKESLTNTILTPVTKPYFYGWAGSLEIAVMKGEEIKQIGFISGVSDEIKSNPEAVRGKVIELAAMQIDRDEHGKFSGLRHAKMIGFRQDKSWKDCSWEQLE